jgi:hypothetical protein
MWCLIAMLVTPGASLPPTDCSFTTEIACQWAAFGQNHKWEDPTVAPYLYICGDLTILRKYQIAQQVEKVLSK